MKYCNTEGAKIRHTEHVQYILHIQDHVEILKTLLYINIENHVFVFVINKLISPIFRLEKLNEHT